MSAPTPGYTLWLKADAGTFQDTAGTTPATVDGEVVKRWNNAGSAGGQFTEATTPPTLKLAILNGLPVVRSDGVDDVLRSSASISTFLSTAEGTVLVLGRYVAITSNSVDAWRNNAMWADDNFEVVGLHAKSSGPTLMAYNYDGSADSAGKTVAAGTWYVFTYVHVAGSPGAIKLGVSDARDASLASTPTGAATNLTGLMSLGRGSSGLSNAEVDIVEVIAYPTGLNQHERLVTETYLAERGALTLPYGVLGDATFTAQPARLAAVAPFGRQVDLVCAIPLAVEIYRGESITLNFTLAGQNILSWGIELTVAEAANSEAKALTATGTVVSGLDGTFRVLLDGDDTAALEPGVYFWDVWRVDEAEERVIALGGFTVKATARLPPPEV